MVLVVVHHLAAHLVQTLCFLLLLRLAVGAEAVVVILLVSLEVLVVVEWDLERVAQGTLQLLRHLKVMPVGTGWDLETVVMAGIYKAAVVAVVAALA